MIRTELGKIQKVSLGNGGYDDAMFGISFTLGGSGWGVQTFWGTWSHRSEHAKYSQEYWEKSHLESYLKLKELMKKAKVNDIKKLEGVPVEVTFKDGNLLDTFRILEEVL